MNSHSKMFLLTIISTTEKQHKQTNVCINYKYYNMIGSMCLKELILTKLLFYARVLFVINGSLLRQIYISANVCESCRDQRQKAMGFNDVGFFSVKGNDYRIHFWYISKDEAINLFKNVDLGENSGTL